MMKAESDIYDHSTTSGWARASLRRFMEWRALLAALILFVIVIILLFRSNEEPSSPSTPEPLAPLSLGTDIPGEERFDQVTGEYIFDGFPGNIVFRGISVPVLDKLSVRKVTISNTILDAKALTDSLQGMTNIQSVSVHARRVIGDFGLVILPSIKEFNYSLYMETNIDLYKPAEVLKQMIFFEKFPGQNWQVERDVLNLGVNLSIWVWGTAVLEVNRAAGLVNVNTHYAEDILKWALGDYTKLIISWSALNNVSVVPSGVKYLNLNNALPPPDKLSALIARTRALEELHLFQPYLDFDEFAPSYYVTPQDPSFQSPVDFSALPLTLRKFTAARMALTTSTPAHPTGIIDLALEETNVTESFLENFPTLFPNLKTFSLFNAVGLPHATVNNTSSRLLEKVVQQTSVTRVVITRFVYYLIDDSLILISLFSQLGLPTVSDIELTKTISANGTAVWSGRELLPNETNYYRYQGLAFNDVDLFTDYLHYDSFDAVSGAAGISLITTSFPIIITIIIMLYSIITA